MSIPNISRAAPLIMGVCLLSMGMAHAQTISASVTVTRPAASCAVSGTNDLAFGAYTLGSGNGSASVSPTATASARFSGSPSSRWGGTHAWGTFALAVSNTTTATSVAVSYPSTLETSGCGSANCRITFGAGAIANSATASASTYSSGAPNIAGSGIGTTTNRYYRLGGSLSGISSSKSTGTYEGDITVTITCGT